MKIVQLTPGTGNFYCGTCLRDNALVTALRAQGHDAVLLPMYLPHFVDEESSVAQDAPIFFGGINVYLQQKSALFRAAPRWLGRLLDSPALLRLAARRAGMTSASDLGELTHSMLLGEQGRQALELEKAVAWLSQPANRPDVVGLSNALLLGLARRIKETLRVPVVCTLQGEDTFLDALPEPERCWSALRERAGDADRYVAVSRSYGETMRRRMGLPPERVEVVPNGINLDGYAPAAGGLPRPPVIGFLARMHPTKGLGTLVEAFLLLKKRGGLPGLRLRVAGMQTEEDALYVGRLKERLHAAGYGSHAEFLPNLARAEKQAFLRTLSVLSVPAAYDEAFGLYVLEALASGVPVVQPARGAFPELIEATGGGILCPPDDPRALADALETALADPERLAALGRCGREAVAERFTSAVMARGYALVCQSAREAGGHAGGA
ncbi:MAG: glycosyltransferase family 4 protein [Chthoniobacteraceae bacterium]|nr:glycosyltransferase family 4 protein [Chthoniobacteraceae bacterium]